MISQIYDGLPPPKDFNSYFGTPSRQSVKKPELIRLLSNLRVTELVERANLMNICQLPQDPDAVTLIKLKELFDSKYGLGSSDKKTTARVMEQVVKHLRESI